MQKKHIIITKLFEFGGSNEHLQTLIRYLGTQNIVLVLENKDQLAHLKNVAGADGATIKVMPHIHPYAHLQYKFTTNLRELFYIARSILALQLLSIRYSFAGITICAVEPERHLYLLWMPFSKVYYILHTTPVKRYTPFTPYTCNKTLGNRKQIITVSRANKNEICKNWEIGSGKAPFVKVIYNCINREKMEGYDDNIKPAGKKVITLGMVIAYKNPDVWLKVATAVTTSRSDVSFEWLGAGPLLNQYQQLTRTTDDISFKGLITNPGPYLQQAAIYYQPSEYETHGIAVVEAMSCGLPCVVSNVGGMPESVIDGHNGSLVDVHNVDAHVNAILRLIDNDALRTEYGQNARERYNQFFTYEKFAAELDKLYA